jgi:hypothetical protein
MPKKIFVIAKRAKLCIVRYKRGMDISIITSVICRTCLLRLKSFKKKNGVKNLISGGIEKMIPICVAL